MLSIIILSVALPLIAITAFAALSGKNDFPGFSSKMRASAWAGKVKSSVLKEVKEAIQQDYYSKMRK
jgi:hypothetical protein